MAASTEAGEEAAMAAGEEGALFPGAEVWVEADTPGEFRRGILMGAGGEEVRIRHLPSSHPCLIRKNPPSGNPNTDVCVCNLHLFLCARVGHGRLCRLRGPRSRRGVRSFGRVACK